MAWGEWRDWFERRRRRFPFGDRYFEGMEKNFPEMERMMEEMFKRFMKQAPEDLSKERESGVLRSTRPIVWGYSITVGSDGKPVVREFGNLKPSARRKPWEPPFSLKEEREPLVDSIETIDEVRAVAELPGVEKEDITLNATRNTLIIKVETKERKYLKELELPAEIDPKSAKSTYKNGVLEVTLKKVEKRKPTGFSINIE